MNYAHLHLYLNHAPIFGLGFGVLVLLYGLARRSCEVVRASFLMFVLSALICVPVFLTGDAAGDVIEGRIPDVPNESLIEPHETAGLLALIFVCITGVTALAAFYVLWKKKECQAPLTLGVLLIALISIGFLVRTGQLGGKINHPELRAGYVMPAEHEKDDDD